MFSSLFSGLRKSAWFALFNCCLLLSAFGATAPGAPTAVSATYKNASAVVSFTPPTSNGGAAITSYTVTASPSGLTATGTASPITIAGLTNGTAYSFSVKATNSVGSGAAGLTVGSLSPSASLALLTAPTAVSAVSGNASAVVSFTGSSSLTTMLTGFGTLIGTPAGTQNYNFLEIDTSKYPAGGLMTIKVTLGNGTSGASYDLFHADAVAIDSGGRPIGSLANGYDVSPGSVTTMSYTFSPTATNKYKLGLEGNWFSATSATNTYTYEVTLTGNTTTPSYTVTSTPGGVTATGTTSPITVTGLTNGTAYTFAVSSTASAVSSAASSASSAVTPVGQGVVAPGSPTSVSATPSNASAAVSFSAPASNGGATITGYTVTASPGGQTATGTASPITVAGLTNGTAYTFTVKATNSVGTGVASTASTAVTPATIPSAPTAVSATYGNGSAVVSFVPPTNNGGAPITGYSVNASPDGLITTGTSSPITITGLTNGKPYFFSINAINSMGLGLAGSIVGDMSPAAPAAVLTAPTAVSAVAGNQSAAVSFSGSSTLTTKLTGSGTLIGTPVFTQNYNFLEIDTSKYPSGGLMTIKVTLGNGSSAASYDLFHSDAVAVDAGGRPVGSLANAYDVSPGSVTTLSYAFSPTATNKYKLGLEGNWGSTLSNNTYTYEVTLTGNTSTPTYTVTSTPGGVTASGNTSPITVTGLTNGTAYTFAVTSSANALNSAVSGASTAVTPMAPITSTTTTTTSTTTTVAATTTTTAASGQKQTLSLAKGWNLIGSGGTQAFSVRDYFIDKSKIVSVWKWLNGQSQWAFYSPQLTSTELQTYADAKGYKALDAINGSDGFWVNANDAVQVDVPFGSTYTAVDHRNSLIKGWNLIAAGESLTPVRFNNYLTPYSGDVPPSIGSDTTTTVYQVNLTSLWAWDAVAMSWYFYAPSLDRDMTLNDYTTGKGYLSFSGNNKKIGPGLGFWVNKP